MSFYPDEYSRNLLNGIISPLISVLRYFGRGYNRLGSDRCGTYLHIRTQVHALCVRECALICVLRAIDV